MAAKEQVISVSMTLNTKGFSDGLVLTDKQAKSFGKSIANALTIDPKSSINALKSIGVEKDKLIKNFQLLNKVIKDSLLISPSQSKAMNDKIKELGKNLDGLKTKSLETAKAMNNIRFNVGDTNKKIKSVQTALENLRKAATAVGTVSVGATGGTRGTGTTSTRTTGETPAQAAARRASIPVSRQGDEFKVLTPQERAQEQSIRAALDKRMQEQRDKIWSEGNKKIASGTTKVFTDMGSSASKGFADKFRELSSHMEKIGKQSRNKFSSLFGANFFADLASNAVQSFARQLTELGKDTILYAARTDELGVALTSLARVNNIATETIDQQEQSIKRLNITTQDARETLARFVNVGFDLNKAAPLARVAQDLGVITGLSTSEELDKLVVAIQTLQSRNLRTAGVFLTVDEVLDKLSATTGRARDSFSTLEKQEAVLNAVMTYGTKVAGTYEAAMDTASKRIRSLEREAREAQNALGEQFQPALLAGVKAVSFLLNQIKDFPGAFTAALQTIGLFSAALILLNSQIIPSLVSGVISVGTAMLTTASNTGIRGSAQRRANEEMLRGIKLDIEMAAAAEKTARANATAATSAINRAAFEKQANNALAKQAEKERMLTETRVSSLSGKISGVLGTIGLIGAAVSTVFTVATLITEKLNQPLPLIKQDIGAIQKSAEETATLQRTYNELQNNTILLKDAELTLHKSIGVENRASLILAEKETDEYRKRIAYQDVIQRQIDSNNQRRNSEVAASAQNIINQFRNFSKESDAAQKIAVQYEDIQKRLNAVKELRKTNPQAVGLEDERALNLQLETILPQQIEQIKKANEAAAEFFNTLKDGQQVALAYGLTLDELLEVRLSDSFAANSEELAKFNAEVRKFKQLQLVDILKQIEKTSLTPEERIGQLSKSFQKQYKEQIDQLNIQRTDLFNKMKDNEATQEELEAFNRQTEKANLNFPKAFAQAYGKSNENQKAFFSTLSQGITQLETISGKTLSYSEITKELDKTVAHAIETDKAMAEAITEQGVSYEFLIKFTEEYITALPKLQQAIREASLEIDAFVGESAEKRGLSFELESKRETLQTLKSISRLQFELGAKQSDLTPYKNNIQAAQRLEASLKRQKKLQDEINEAKDAQLIVENEIAVLRARLAIPLVNTELMAQKAILETIQERREEEQKLTTDIALEITKRKRFGVDSGRLVAEAFLEAQRGENEAVSGATKSFLNAQLQQGNNAIFTNNPLIREAIKQSEKMAQIEAKGGLQVAKITEGNDIAKNTQSLVKQTSDNVVSSGEKIVSAIQQAPAFTGGVGSGGFPTFGNVGSTPNAFAATFKAKMQSLGMQPGAITWMLANLKRESGFDLGTTQRISVDPINNGSRNAGAFQWNSSGRLQQYQRFLGSRGLNVSVARAVDQADFMGQELQGGYNRFLRIMQTPGLSSEQYYKAAAGYIGFSDSPTKRGPGGRTWREINRSKNFQFARQLGGIPDFSPTAGVIAEAVKTTPSTSKILGLDIIKKTYGLDIADLQELTGGKGGALKGPAGQIHSMLLQAATLKDAFGKVTGTPNDFAAAQSFTDDMTSRVKAVDISKATRAIRWFNQNSIRALEAAEEWEKYETEISEEREFGADRRRTQDTINGLRLMALNDPRSTGYRQAFGEARSARVASQVDETKELIKLQEEGIFRIFQAEAYRARQKKRFDRDQIIALQATEDAETDLAIKREAYADKNSLYYRNIIRNERLVRAQAKQTLKEETDAIRRYNREYLKSEDNRTRIFEEATRDREAAYRDLVESMIKMDEAYGKQNIFLQEELAARQKEIRNSQEREFADTRLRQLDAENEYIRKTTDPFNSAEFRTRGLEKINSMMTDSTTLMSNLFSDTFDGISQGFGSLIDKMTERMGIFGGAIGNLLKGITNNIFGALFKDVLGGIAPTDPAVAEAMGGKSAADNVSKLSDAAATSYAAQMTYSNAFVTASADMATNVYNLSGSIANASATIIAVAGTLAQTASNIINALPSGGGGGAGGVGSGGGINGLIRSATTTGMNQVAQQQAALPGIPNIADIATIVHGPGSSGIIGSGAQAILGRVPQAGGALGVLQGAGQSALGGILGGQGLKAIGGSLLAGAPMLGAGLGGLLGGQSAGGQMLGQLGGLLGGVAAIGALGALGFGGATAAGLFGTSLVASGGLTTVGGVGGLFGAGGALAGIGSLFGGVGGFFGATGAAATALGATVILAPIAAALLIGGALLARNKRRREEEKIRNQAMLDALPALQELLKGVKTDKIDGTEALTRADEIRKQYVDQMSQLKDKKTRNIALKDVSRLDTVIAEIKIAAKNQSIRRELDERMVPTYATGGVGSGVIRISRGEDLFVPHAAGSFSGADIAAGGIPGYATGGMYTGMKLKGSFDGRDNILARVPKGTVIANPRQSTKIRSARGYATGGVAFGRGSSSTAQGAYMMQPPSVTAIIVFSTKEAEELGRQIPNSVIVGKVRQHVRATGTTGLAGDIFNV
jgi:hypothetical protein